LKELPLQRLERIFLFVLLLLATGAGQAFFSAPSTVSTSENQPITQVVFAMIYLGLFLYLLKNYRNSVLFLIQREKWTAVICFWVLASVVWSVDPLLTLRRAFALVGTSMVGMYLGMKFEPKQQLRMIALVIGLGAIGSLVVALLLPGTGITDDGFWQGIYFPKNSLGRMMALGAHCFALLALSERRQRVVRSTMFLLCCALLLLSRSATAVVVCFLMLALLPFRKLLFLRTRKLVLVFPVMFGAVSAIAIWVVVHLDDILNTLGRNSSLTGRIPLWQYVAKEIAARPIQGWGFLAFWNSWEGERVSDSVNWEVAVPHAHNGFLEVWLGIGVIGLAILLIGLAQNLRSALRFARNNRDIDQSWPLILLVFTVLYNLTENSFLAVNSLMWMAYVANSFWMVRKAQEERYAFQREAELELVLSA
jgi:exopolysaccharide production protein ExoQ